MPPFHGAPDKRAATRMRSRVFITALAAAATARPCCLRDRSREYGAAPVLHIDPQVPLVPGAQCRRFTRLKEDPADSCHSLHPISDSSCSRSLAATAAFSVALVSPRQWKRRQPRLTTNDPAFVGR